MLTRSKIEMNLILFKSRMINLTPSELSKVEELAFNAEFEESIYIVLKNIWHEYKWILIAVSEFLSIFF